MSKTRHAKAGWILLLTVALSGCDSIATAIVQGAVESAVATTVVAAAVVPAINEANPALSGGEAFNIELEEQIPVYPADHPIVALSAQVKEQSALSCARESRKPPASEEAAMGLLRQLAKGLGGNALTGVNCDARGGMSLSKNCFSWVECRGMIIQVPPGDGEQGSGGATLRHGI